MNRRELLAPLRQRLRHARPGRARWPDAAPGRRRRAGPLAPSRRTSRRKAKRRHLPVHVRRAVARRHVRPQAAPRSRQRQAACPSRSPSSCAPRRATCSASPVEVREARRVRASRSASCSRTSPRCVDDLCVIRSMVADNINHNGACLQMNTGEQAFSRPSLGSWLLYGLGTENQNLPGFVVLSPAQPAQGAPLLELQLPAGRLPGHARRRPRTIRSPTSPTRRSDAPTPARAARHCCAR